MRVILASAPWYGLIIVLTMVVCLFSDINECFEAALRAADACEDDPNTQCINDEGSFNCSCVPGYHRVNNECQRKLLKRQRSQLSHLL